MINYEKFKEIVEKELINYLPEDLREKKLCIYPVEKVNMVMDAISLLDSNENISPVIYVNQLYETYKSYVPIEKTSEFAASIIVDGMNKIPEMKSIDIDFTKAKDSIVFQLINTASNKELLEKVPHREFLDLSIIYRWILKNTEDGIMSIIIKNNMMKEVGLDEEALFEKALENTKRLFPTYIKNMKDVISDISSEDELPDTALWVITNASLSNGAAVMIYEDVLYELSCKLNSDLYIIPSSIHQILALSTFFASPRELVELVKVVNMTDVLPNEVLSDNIYYYSRKLRMLAFANTTSLFKDFKMIISKNEAEALWCKGLRNFSVLCKEDESDRYADCFETWEEIISAFPDAIFGIDNATCTLKSSDIEEDFNDKE